jgi:(2R)-ethylmalonyl-CoA mutase
MEPSIAAARAGASTGEWAGVLREIFGEYRGPTGISEGALVGASASGAITAARERVAAVEQRVGRKLKILVGKPGLDGHSNGAEQVAIRARDLGMEVVYEGIRLTPAQIVRAAIDEDVHLVGLSILSGSHLSLVPEVVNGLRGQGVDIPVVAGGIIPPDDAERLREAGVAAVFTPADYELSDVLASVAELVG